MEPHIAPAGSSPSGASSFAAPGTAGAPRHAGLDGLRGIAVLLVLYCHAPQLFGKNDGSDAWPWAGSRGAWIGVDLFFVLSGFLITGLLFADRGRPGALARFWVRRALRIFPLALLYLGVLTSMVSWVPHLARLADPASVWWALTYTTNVRVLLEGWDKAVYDILWSLAVEEHFYLLWPFVVLFLRTPIVVGVAVALVVSAPLLRFVLLPWHDTAGVYVATWCRWDALAVGALLACAWRSRHREAVAAIAGVCALPATAWLAYVVLSPVPAADPSIATWFHVVGLSAVAVACLAWVAVALDPPRWLAPLLQNRWLGATGRISYGLYVWHLLVGEVARPWLLGGTALRSAQWLVLVFVVAYASHRLFEAPILRLRDRLEPSSAG